MSATPIPENPHQKVECQVIIVPTTHAITDIHSNLYTEICHYNTNLLVGSISWRTLCSSQAFLAAGSLSLVALAATVPFLVASFAAACRFIQNCSIFLDSRLMHCPLRNGPRDLNTDKWRHYFVLLK